jgi:hypothetical protein
MFTLTNPASARLAHLLETKGDAAVARIFCRKHKLRLGVGQLRPGDQTFSHEGRVVLALDQRISTSLSRRRLYVRQTDTGPRLKLQPQ